MDKNSLAHTTWECKYHIVFAPRRKNYISANTSGYRKNIYEINYRQQGK